SIRFDRAALASPAAAIYDARGAEVRRLAGQVLEDGRVSLVWDGRDQGGRETAPGIYFVRAGEGPSARVVRLR
ncbi:MAG: FlgD immunoglobulin-like domain containing protein, partial [Candidatus Eisenbacteria bacterium]